MSMAHLPLTHLGLGPRGCSHYPLHEAPRGLAGLLSPDFESLRLGAVKPPSRSRPWLPLPPAGVTSTTKSQQHPPGPGWFSWVINPPWPPALQTTACERSVGGRSLALPPETLVLIRRSLSPCPGPPHPPLHRSAAASSRGMFPSQSNNDTPRVGKCRRLSGT